MYYMERSLVDLNLAKEPLSKGVPKGQPTRVEHTQDAGLDNSTTDTTNEQESTVDIRLAENPG